MLRRHQLLVAWTTRTACTVGSLTHSIASTPYIARNALVRRCDALMRPDGRHAGVRTLRTSPFSTDTSTSTASPADGPSANLETNPLPASSAAPPKPSPAAVAPKAWSKSKSHPKTAPPPAEDDFDDPFLPRDPSPPREHFTRHSPSWTHDDEQRLLQLRRANQELDWHAFMGKFYPGQPFALMMRRYEMAMLLATPPPNRPPPLPQRLPMTPELWEQLEEETALQRRLVAELDERHPELAKRPVRTIPDPFGRDLDAAPAPAAAAAAADDTRATPPARTARSLFKKASPERRLWTPEEEQALVVAVEEERGDVQAVWDKHYKALGARSVKALKTRLQAIRRREKEREKEREEEERVRDVVEGGAGAAKERLERNGVRGDDFLAAVLVHGPDWSFHALRFSMPTTTSTTPNDAAPFTPLECEHLFWALCRERAQSIAKGMRVMPGKGFIETYGRRVGDVVVVGSAGKAHGSETGRVRVVKEEKSDWGLETAVFVWRSANPFDVPVRITHLRATLAHRGVPVARIDQPVSGFHLPARGKAASPPMKLEMKVEGSGLPVVMAAMRGELEGGAVVVDGCVVVDAGLGWVTEVSL
ncbi:hypothetical protein HDU96_007628 [Phlyctochytrium bullatum]|nr:hypothetical protein HDU96_007628 [Phlyctochytrium bullatum]